MRSAELLFIFYFCLCVYVGEDIVNHDDDPLWNIASRHVRLYLFPQPTIALSFFLHITHDWIASLTLLIYQPLSFYLFCHFSFLLFLYTGETIVEDRNHIRTWVHPPFSRGLVHIHIFMKRVSQSNVLIDFAMGNNLRTEIKRKVFFQLFLLFVRTTFVFLSCDTNRIFEIFLF